MQLIKKNWIYILFAVSLIVFIATRISHKTSELEVKTFKINTGWGYKIYVRDSLKIQQDYIPGVEGFKSFVNEEQAKKIGDLVKYKWQKDPDNLPAVSLHELDSCGIKR
jgi:hypothetical protein